MLAMRRTMAKDLVSGAADAVTYDAQGCIDSSSDRNSDINMELLRSFCKLPVSNCATLALQNRGDASLV
jgi:hypothetical protein